MAEKMKALKEDIAARIERYNGKIPFNPFSHFHLTKVLSVVAPHFYTNEELAQIEDIEEAIVKNKNKKRKYQTDEEGMAREGKRVKITKKEEAMAKEGKRVKTAEKEEDKGIRVHKNKKRRYETDADDDADDECMAREGKRVQATTKIKKPKLEKPPPLPAPTLPIELENLIRELNGSDVNYVMHKTLYQTDLNDSNNRLSMPENDIQSDFLTEREKEMLNSMEGGKPVGLEVIVLDPCFREFNLTLKKWKMNTACTYNLIKNWKLISKHNNFEVGQEFYIWSFRVDGKLYLILNNKGSVH